MKKKVYAFLLVLASVIACIVCLAACNKGGSDDLKAEDCIGTYEFVSLKSVYKESGKQDEEFNAKVGENGVTKDYYVLEVENDNTWTMTMTYAPGQTMTENGTWEVDGGKLVISQTGGNTVYNGELSGEIMTLTTKTEEANYKTETTLKLKKVVESSPAE